MNAQTQLEKALHSRISLANEWIIRVDRELKEAAEKGWPMAHTPKLLEEPVEVQGRVMGYFRDLGYRVHYGKYSDGWGTVWFNSEPPKVKEPGVISQVVHRLFGGSKDRH